MMCDGFLHLAMSQLEGRKEKRARTVSTQFRWTQSNGNKMLEVGIANRRRCGGEQRRRVFFFFFFVKTLSSVNVKGSGVVSPNDSDKSHLLRRSVVEIWDTMAGTPDICCRRGTSASLNHQPVRKSIKLTSRSAWPHSCTSAVSFRSAAFNVLPHIVGVWGLHVRQRCSWQLDQLASSWLAT